MSEHTVLVKFHTDRRAQRWPYEMARSIVMEDADHRDIVRHTRHGDGSETMVTDYWIKGNRWRITERTAV